MNQIQHNLIRVLETIISDIKQDPVAAEVYAEQVSMVLNDLQDQDFFGTESQNDPRGDFRSGDWSIFGEVQ